MSTGQRKAGADRELEAIGSILRALEGLDGESIQRVFDYVLGRMSLGRPSPTASAPISVAPTNVVAPSDSPRAGRQVSIRDLKEEKNPESSNQMAALVAYYLSEIVDPNERQNAINASDLEKYFKQAGFKLPKSIPQALPNAAAAGYFDAEGNGRYRLNPVGYNLVVHGLPRDQSKAPVVKKRRKARKSRK